MPNTNSEIGTRREREVTSPSVQRSLPLPASLDCDLTLRTLTSQAIRDCNLSREQIVEQMSVLAGHKITEQSLNCWTAESKDKHRFPAIYLPAFCAVTQDVRILQAVAQKLGLAVVGPEEQRLIALGRVVEEERVAALRKEQLLAAGGIR